MDMDVEIFLSSPPTETPTRSLLSVQLVKISYKVSKANTDEETESHDHEAAPPLENLKWTCNQK
jgi:hypothetical protein